jgi:hypothetical protein
MHALRAWYSRFASYLLLLGFAKPKAATLLLVFCRGQDMVYLLLYVDDIVMTTSKVLLIHHVIVVLFNRNFPLRIWDPCITSLA